MYRFIETLIFRNIHNRFLKFRSFLSDYESLIDFLHDRNRRKIQPTAFDSPTMQTIYPHQIVFPAIDNSNEFQTRSKTNFVWLRRA